MEHKHTAGPWGWSHRETANGNYSTQVYDEKGKEIADIAWYPVTQNNITITSREANARLIAAAPELLEALQAAVECGMVPTSTVKDGGANKYARQVQVADMIRAAIARATGTTA